jgi:hyperosmotically inducible protein
MKTLHLRPLALVLLVGSGVLFSACHRPDPAATVGAKIDRAAEIIAGNADGAERAAEAVAATAGVAATVAGDAAMTARVKSVLISELDIAALDIEVDTKDAIVTLSGSVESDFQYERARHAVLGVAGVRYLLDRIVVKTLEPG